MINIDDCYLFIKVSLTFILALFVFFGLDIRKNNKETKQFASDISILVMKIFCLLLVFIYLISIIFVDSCDYFDFASLLLTTSGVILVYWAKKTLGKNFTWTGYYLPDAEIVKTGPYRFFNHPLYYGVYLFEAGALIRYIKLTALSEYQIVWIILGMIPLVYAISFNFYMSRYESKMINKKQ